jgi:A/G-specific adenine glycosylase
MIEMGGVLPADTEGWRRLPGVGPYAAGAIASIGLGLPEPAVDANVRRVLGRWLGAVDLTPAREQA